MKTTVGQLMVNDALPEDLRNYDRVLTKGETDKMLEEVAHRYPEQYRDISWKLMQLGRNAAYEEGTTLRLSDLITPVDKTGLLKHVDAQSRAIDAAKGTDEEKDDARDELYSMVHGEIKRQTYEDALKRGNPLALQVMSKARGSQDQLTSLMSTPGTYQDSKGKTFPVFIRRSYAEGLDPHEFYAASYGARTGIRSTKEGTRAAGYLGKLFSTAAIDSVVTEDDCGTPYGIPVPTSDSDNVGTILAQDTEGVKAGTVLTRATLSQLEGKTKQIMVRSPMTCGAHKGVCRHCVGLREDGKLPSIGYNIGVNATSALAEQLAQNALGVKHTGKKHKGTDEYSGFNVIKNLSTVPGNFPDRAAMAELDGTVESVDEAPQGGSVVVIDGKEHFVGPDMDLRVKVGDTVEAGDALSGGILNPSDVVRLKGVGEGRRYFAERMTKAFRDSGYGANRRNIEVLSRSLINHMQIEDPDAAGTHLPGDVVTYNSWAYGYKPRVDAQTLPLKKSVGRYLEMPAMHYTIGTKLTKKMTTQLGDFGVETVTTHHEPVGASPTMVSVVNTPEHVDDWMARLGSTYLQKRLLEDVHRGATSNVHSIHPIPGLAKGTEFGQHGKEFTY